MTNTPKLNQRDRVYQYIQTNGSITSMDAFHDLGITALSARINELEKKGIRIIRKRIESINRYGSPTHYTRYSFPEEDHSRDEHLI